MADMRRTLAITIAAVGLLAACGGDGDDASANTTTTTDRSTTTTAPGLDAVKAWCFDMAAVADMTTDDSVSPDEGLDARLRVAEAGVKLDHPEIAEASADIVEHLTWADRNAAEFERTGDTLAPPDPQKLSDATVTLLGACRAIGAYDGPA